MEGYKHFPSLVFSFFLSFVKIFWKRNQCTYMVKNSNPTKKKKKITQNKAPFPFISLPRRQLLLIIYYLIICLCKDNPSFPFFKTHILHICVPLFFSFGMFLRWEQILCTFKLFLCAFAIKLYTVATGEFHFTQIILIYRR